MSLDANRNNIVSGYMVSNLALLALAEQRGGFRPAKQNRMLCVRTANAESVRTFVAIRDSPPEGVSSNSSKNFSRREELISHWENSKPSRRRE